MSLPEWLREMEERKTRAYDMVVALCRPRGTEGSREWSMSIPARPDYDPDLVIGAALRDHRHLLALVRKMGEALETIVNDDEGYRFPVATAEKIVSALTAYRHGPGMRGVGRD